jgi:hypothetical protein
MSNLELLDRAASAATCQMLTAAGASLVGAGAVSLWAGGTGFVAIGAGGLGLIAANYLCPDMPVGGDPPVPGIDGCRKVDGYGDLEIKIDEVWSLAFGPGTPRYDQGRAAVEILDQYVYYSDPFGKWVYFIEWQTVGGGLTNSVDIRFDTESQARAASWRINPVNGECLDDPSTPNPVPPEAETTTTYIDNITNCTYQLTLQGFAQQEQGGDIQPVYLVESPQTLRQSGGRMGGCNFPPTIYMPGGGNGGNGGGYTIPVPDGGAPPGPGGGLPWWAAPLASAVAGAVVGQIVNRLLDALQPPVLEADFTLTAPCNKDEEGNPLTRTWEFPEQAVDSRLLEHQIALMEMIQQQLDWKTPICGNEPPVLLGDWVSIRFISDGISPGGTNPLRKLFRYRSQSSRSIEQLRAYWAGFTWTAGPVIVQHKGTWWGTPQVWASTAEEGKRVLRFAAEEAGATPDTDGQWIVTGSTHPRYGMPGTMRIQTYRGRDWITSRNGPSGPVEL